MRNADPAWRSATALDVCEKERDTREHPLGAVPGARECELRKRPAALERGVEGHGQRGACGRRVRPAAATAPFPERR